MCHSRIQVNVSLFLVIDSRNHPSKAIKIISKPIQRIDSTQLVLSVLFVAISAEEGAVMEDYYCRTAQGW